MSGANVRGLQLVREVRLSYHGTPRAFDGTPSPGAVWRFALSLIGTDPREHLLALYLDGRHRVVGHRVVSIGTATASLVHPREVYQAAICAGACGVILAHNHPSGVVTPSAEDRNIEERIARAGELLGVELLDALVVTPDGYDSAREAGRLPLREARP